MSFHRENTANVKVETPYHVRNWRQLCCFKQWLVFWEEGQVLTLSYCLENKKAQLNTFTSSKTHFSGPKMKMSLLTCDKVDLV